MNVHQRRPCFVIRSKSTRPHLVGTPLFIVVRIFFIVRQEHNIATTTVVITVTLWVVPQLSIVGPMLQGRVTWVLMDALTIVKCIVQFKTTQEIRVYAYCNKRTKPYFEHHCCING